MTFVYHQLFCDESGKFHNPKTKHVTFSGLSVTANKLEKFDEEWRGLLLSYELPSLHMKVIAQLDQKVGYRFQPNQTIDERTDLLLPFADCINKYLEMGFIQAWDLKGFERIPYEGRVLLGGSNDPALWAFIRGLREIYDHLGPDDRLSIICDDDEATAWDMYCHYRAFGKTMWELQKIAIALSFANDVHFPALQAADMAAFLSRCQSEKAFYGNPNPWERLYTRLITEPRPPWGTMRWFIGFHTEEALSKAANDLKKLADRRELEKRQSKQRIGKLRQQNKTADSRSARSNHAKVGRRKGGGKA